MARETYRYSHNGRGSARRGSAAPMVISDEMSDTWHPATGAYYSSKSAFRRATRENGCREVGNDVSRETELRHNARQREIREGQRGMVKQALEMWRGGHRPEPLARGKVNPEE